MWCGSWDKDWQSSLDLSRWELSGARVEHWQIHLQVQGLLHVFFDGLRVENFNLFGVLDFFDLLLKLLLVARCEVRLAELEVDGVAVRLESILDYKGV